MPAGRALRTATAVLPVLVALGCATLTPTEETESSAGPPGAPDTARAEEMLADLRTAPEGSMDGYDRDEFPHWGKAEGENCNVRERVLIRDGENVRTGSDCYPTSGTWDSPYDDGSWSDPSDLDIDHMVPLAAAWRSGASDWTQRKRERFANDLSGPQLLAVTDNVNQSKGDDTPDEWLPPDESFHCEYVRSWIGTKHNWDLTVTGAERTTLRGVLDGC
ncbi:hypothetical protein J2S53_003020 [Actinopolyspora lacussalsi]|nr:hypothetical protein [Actinopolyspora lacussalsi]